LCLLGDLLAAKGHELASQIDHALIVQRATGQPRGGKAVLAAKLGDRALRLLQILLEHVELLLQQTRGIARGLSMIPLFP
jgi:hypothetical protein